MCMYLQINDNDEIFIDFEDVRGETKMTFIHFHDTVLIKVNIHKEPFLIIIEPKSIVFSRLNTFFSSINNCRPGPLSMHNGKVMITPSITVEPLSNKDTFLIRTPL